MEQLNEAVEKRAGGTRLKKGGGMGGPLLLALGLTAAIAGGAYLGLCAYAQNSAAILFFIVFTNAPPYTRIRIQNSVICIRIINNPILTESPWHFNL